MLFVSESILQSWFLNRRGHTSVNMGGIKTSYYSWRIQRSPIANFHISSLWNVNRSFLQNSYVHEIFMIAQIFQECFPKWFLSLSIFAIPTDCIHEFRTCALQGLKILGLQKHNQRSMHSIWSFNSDLLILENFQEVESHEGCTEID